MMDPNNLKSAIALAEQWREITRHIQAMRNAPLRVHIHAHDAKTQTFVNLRTAGAALHQPKLDYLRQGEQPALRDYLVAHMVQTRDEIEQHLLSIGVEVPTDA